MPKHLSSIPIIDISPLTSGEIREQQSVADQLGRAASEVGFLYVRGHGINEALFTRGYYGDSAFNCSSLEPANN